MHLSTGEDQEKKKNTILGISVIRGLIARLSDRRKLKQKRWKIIHHGSIDLLSLWCISWCKCFQNFTMMNLS